MEPQTDMLRERLRILNRRSQGILAHGKSAHETAISKVSDSSCLYFMQIYDFEHNLARFLPRDHRLVACKPYLSACRFFRVVQLG
jgi:hypothetical protein